MKYIKPVFNSKFSDYNSDFKSACIRKDGCFYHICDRIDSEYLIDKFSEYITVFAFIPICRSPFSYPTADTTTRLSSSRSRPIQKCSNLLRCIDRSIHFSQV